MDKKYFRIVSSIQMVANMSFGLLIAIIASLIVYLIAPSQAALIFFGSMCFFYLVSFFLGIKVIAQMKGINFENRSQKYLDRTIRQTYWPFMSFVLAFTVQQLRTEMWKIYSEEKTKGIELESEIIKVNIELLEELNKDGYISEWRYDHQKGKFTSALKVAIAMEENEKEAKKLRDEDEI